MNLNCDDINELIRNFLILKNELDRKQIEIEKLYIALEGKDEIIKTLKEVLNEVKE